MGEAASARAQRGPYYGWSIVGVLIVSQMAASGLTHNALSLFVPGWSRDLNAPVSTLMLAIVAQIGVSCPLSPFVGALCDKYSPRWIFGIGLAGVALFFVAISFATEAWHIIVLYALSSPFLLLCTTTPANALIARWFKRRLGLSLGLTAFGLGLGGVLLPPLIAVLLPEVGWRMIWRGAGLVVGLVVLPLVTIVVRYRPTEREGLHYVIGGNDGALSHHGHGTHTGDSGMGWRTVLSRRNFWLLVFIYLAVMGTGSAFHQNVAPYAASHGFGRETAALLLSTMSMSHLASTLGLGLLTDRVGARLPLIGLPLVVAAGLGLMLMADGLPAVIVAAALIGFNTGVFTPLAAAISAEFGASGFGRAFGMAMFFLPLSSPLAFALAKTSEDTGSYAPAMLGFICLLLLAAVVASLLREPSTESQGDAAKAIA